MKTRVGLCGFTMSMQAYARNFPVVEVQSTFYQPPIDSVLKRWLASTGPSLEYTMKVWQLVTHAATSPTYRRMKRKLSATDEPGFFRPSTSVDEGWKRSLQCADVLSATGMLFQCPASFHPDPENVRHMQRFFERIERPRARLLWEPRGAKWLNEHSLALSLCKDLNLVYVVDPFVTPPHSGHPVYWRLHGIGGARSSYTNAQLQQLHRMLLDAAPSGTGYVLFNNIPRISDAKRFALMLTGEAGVPFC